MIYLHKILPLFVLPLAIALAVLVAGILLKRRWVMVSALAFLWLCSTPLISVRAVRASEGWAERGVASEAPAVDAIVVLSEGRIQSPGMAAVSEWRDGDRFYGGIELFKAGKAPRLVFTGGAVPWEPTAPLEGEVLAGYAAAMGVPVAQILTTTRVVNTEEEARAVSALLRERMAGAAASGSSPRILLVTSAFHMARAKRLFEATGMSVTAFPVDFKTSAGTSFSLTDLMPNATSLALTELAWREGYGRLFYRVFR